MQGKEWIEREKQRRDPHLDLFGDERRKCEKERMDAERLFHTFRLQPKKQPSAKKMPKQGIKVPPTWRINIHASTERPCTDPGLHLSHTRVSVALWWVHPGLKRLCKLFLTKEKPILMKKEAVLTGFAPLPERSPFLSYN